MSLRKKTVLLVLVMGSFSFFLRGQDTLSRVQLAFGINYFPIQYFKFFNTKGFNAVHFGYNIGCCKELRKINVRAGFNFNYYQAYNTKEFSICFEGGAEVPFLKRKSKWVLNGGVLFFISKWYSIYEYNLFRQEIITNQIEVGPNLLFGRNIKTRWNVFTELNCSWGFYNKTHHGQVIEENWAVYSFRFLGIGCRYKF